MYDSIGFSLACLLVLSLASPSAVFSVKGEDVGRIPTIVPVSQLQEGLSVPIKTPSDNITKYPPWANLTLLLIGQKVLRNNFVGLGYGIGLATVATTTPDIIRVVLGLGGITQPKRSIAFFASATLQLKYWGTVDLVNDEANFFKSLNLVHAIHAKIDHNASENSHVYANSFIPEPVAGLNPYNVNLRLFNAFEADLRASRLKGFERSKLESNFQLTNGNALAHHPVNQFALVIVLWTQVHAATLFPTNVFIHATEEEIFGFIHLMALIGAGIGIEDRYNICLQPDLDSAKSYFSQLFKTYILPPLFHLEYEYMVQIQATLPGIADLVFPFVDESFMMIRLCEDFLEIKCPAVEQHSSQISRLFNVAFSGGFAHILFRLAPVRSIANYLSNSLLHLVYLQGMNRRLQGFE